MSPWLTFFRTHCSKAEHHTTSEQRTNVPQLHDLLNAMTLPAQCKPHTKRTSPSARLQPIDTLLSVHRQSNHRHKKKIKQRREEQRDMSPSNEDEDGHAQQVVRRPHHQARRQRKCNRAVNHANANPPRTNRYVSHTRAAPSTMMNASANTTGGFASVVACCATHSCWVAPGCASAAPEEAEDEEHAAVVFRHSEAEQPYNWHCPNGLRGALDAKGLKPHMSLKKHSLRETTCTSPAVLHLTCTQQHEPHRRRVLDVVGTLRLGWIHSWMPSWSPKGSFDTHQRCQPGGTTQTTRSRRQRGEHWTGHKAGG